VLAGVVEFLGWFGAVTVLTGYLLFSLGTIPNGPVYQLFNLVGGLSVAVNVAAHHAVPSTIVNSIWAVVALVVLVRTGRARRAARRGGSVAAEAPVLHAEPPTITAVLPVIGPALRDHEPDPTAVADRATRLQAEPADPTHAGDATDATDAPTAAAPMTESIPAITATIALALVAAAQEHASTAGRTAATTAAGADAATGAVTDAGRGSGADAAERHDVPADPTHA